MIVKFLGELFHCLMTQYRAPFLESGCDNGVFARCENRNLIDALDLVVEMQTLFDNSGEAFTEVSI